MLPQQWLSICCHRQPLRFMYMEQIGALVIHWFVVSVHSLSSVCPLSIRRMTCRVCSTDVATELLGFALCQNSVTVTKLCHSSCQSACFGMIPSSTVLTLIHWHKCSICYRMTSDTRLLYLLYFSLICFFPSSVVKCTNCNKSSRSYNLFHKMHSK